MPFSGQVKFTVDEWLQEGESRFGANKLHWKFVCPACGNIQSAEGFREHKEAGATPETVYQQCIGRFTGGKDGPHKCDWAAFGLFRGPHLVTTEDLKEIPTFAFAPGEPNERN